MANASRFIPMTRTRHDLALKAMQVTIQFVGGSLDGTVTFEYPPTHWAHPPEVNLAIGFYALTEGRVGHASVGASLAATEILTTPGASRNNLGKMKKDSYRVISREEKDGNLFIRAEEFDPEYAPPGPLRLDEYTQQQLINELIRRPEFKGCVLHARMPNASQGNYEVSLSFGRDTSESEIAAMLRSHLKRIESKGAD